MLFSLVYGIVAVPSLLYGCEIWTIKQKIGVD